MNLGYFDVVHVSFEIITKGVLEHLLVEKLDIILNIFDMKILFTQTNRFLYFPRRLIQVSLSKTAIYSMKTGPNPKVIYKVKK